MRFQRRQEQCSGLFRQMISCRGLKLFSLSIVVLLYGLSITLGPSEESSSSISNTNNRNGRLRTETTTTTSKLVEPSQLLAQYPDLVADCERIVSNSPKDDGEIATVNLKPSFRMNVHKKEADDISKRLLQTGCYECDIIPFTIEALQSRTDSIFLDIGSNMGLYSMAAAASGHSVIAFEPVELSYRKICQSVFTNNFQKYITVVNKAISNRNNQLVRFRPWKGNFAGIKMIQTHAEAVKDKVEGVDYATTRTIDSLPRDLVPTHRPVVAKLDVEGFECEALLGMMEYLEQVEILYFQMETANDRFKTNPCYTSHDIMGMFVRKGLEPYLVHKGTRTPLDVANYKEWKSPKHANFDVGWYPKGTKFQSSLVDN